MRFLVWPCCCFVAAAFRGKDLDLGTHEQNLDRLHEHVDHNIKLRLGAVNNTSGITAACRGHFFGSAGDCPAVVVVDESGQEHAVQMYCYDTLALNQGKKTSRGELGSCFVPRKKPCNENDQCRPGTACLPSEETDPLMYRCISISDSISESNISDVAGMVRTMAKYLLDSLPERHNASGLDGRAAVFDQRSGVLSPYLVSTPLARAAFEDISRSFVDGISGKHAASGSGASFIHSSDGLFIAKSLPRVSEWDDMALYLMESLPDLIGLRGKPCDGVACWARAALEETTLNVPVMAFKHFGKAWVVLPSVFVMRCYALHRQLPNSNCSLGGKPKLLDVKPPWARSKQRATFFRKLADLDFRPGGPDVPSKQRKAWLEVSGMLVSDTQYLASGDYPFMDYSLLFEVYEPENRLEEPGSGCVPSRQCFLTEQSTWDKKYLRFLNLSTKKCTILCVSIIDYFLRYDSTRKTIESTIIHNKWDEYDSKVVNMIACVGHMARYTNITEPLTKTNLEEARLGKAYQETSGYRLGPTKPNKFTRYYRGARYYQNEYMVATLHRPGANLDITLGQGHLRSSACHDYLKLVCSQVKIKELRGYSTCTYLVSSARALACKAFLAADCKQRHEDYLRQYGLTGY